MLELLSEQDPGQFLDARIHRRAPLQMLEYGQTVLLEQRHQMGGLMRVNGNLGNLIERGQRVDIRANEFEIRHGTRCEMEHRRALPHPLISIPDGPTNAAARPDVIIHARFAHPFINDVGRSPMPPERAVNSGRELWPIFLLDRCLLGCFGWKRTNLRYRERLGWAARE